MNFCLGIILPALMATHPHANSHKRKIKKIAVNICKYSANRKLNPYVTLSIIRHESSFKTRTLSKTGDYGLMQINKRWFNPKCNLFKIKCNIKEGTRIMAMWKRVCVTHKHKHIHWLRHYNWKSKKHHLRVLWLTKAYEEAAKGHLYLYNIIKRRRRYQALKLNYKCIKKNLCGALK